MNPEVEHALELARKRYGPNLEGALPPEQQKLTPEIARKIQASIIQRLHGGIHPRVAFAAGQKAKRTGLMRVTPYYEKPGSDHFWLAGYDGKTIQEAIESQ